MGTFELLICIHLPAIGSNFHHPRSIKTCLLSQGLDMLRSKACLAVERTRHLSQEALEV